MSHARESSAAIIRRCLAMLRRLQRGPATRAALIAAAGYEDTVEPALTKRFEADKRRLTALFGAEWRYHKATGGYEWLEAWEGWCDLPDTALEALAFLQKTFEPGAPMADEVQNFLGTLVGYLPPERRGDLLRLRTALEVQWGQQDDDVIDATVEANLQRALQQRRLIAMTYSSPERADGRPLRHIVEPWALAYMAVWGHYYLRGYCRYIEDEMHRPIPQRRYIYYRLGRIHAVELLPEKLSAPPTVFPKPLRYRLAARIARQGNVTRHAGIRILHTEAQDDGSVIVDAETDDVWWAVRTLLHYGANCEVLGGPEALAEMRQTVEAMAAVYEKGTG